MRRDIFYKSRRWFEQVSDLEPYAHRETEKGREQRFWLAMLYGAMAAYLTTVVVLWLYTWLTPDQPNRDWITLVSFVVLVFTFGFYVLRHQIVTMRYRLVYLVFSDILAAAFILLISALDGGIDSPIAALLILPVLYLAIGYPRPAVLICGMAIVAGAAALTQLSYDALSVPAAMFNLIALAIGLMLAVIGATARDWEKREIRRLRERLEVLATTDELTGCLNQRAFSSALEREIDHANGSGRLLSLLVIDIDHFKQINDCHGHADGDGVLRRLGLLLTRLAGESAIAGRTGGDELAILAPMLDARSASALAERIGQAFREGDERVRATLSIGVATARSGREQATTLFRRADNALYQAKEQGRDRVAVAPEPASGADLQSA